MIKTVIRYLSPHIKIHVWGGFGSQLFALVMAWRISSKFKCRRVRLVFHSSGVTERIRELPSEWLQNVSFIEVKDFVNTPPSKKPSQSKIAVEIDKTCFLGILLFSGILARANSDKELNRLKPWVLEVRGHYTDLKVNDLVLIGGSAGSFRKVTAVSTQGTITVDATITVTGATIALCTTQMFDPQKQSLVFPLPYQAIRSMRTAGSGGTNNTTFYIYQKFTQTLLISNTMI